ncbi:hypothetical protein [Pseudalkalibacillus caeni]|uniref:Permease n=1 Tax=Exobacillus caeni TaxID=2574798 RepID=A0A5R9F7Z9_9BACL|nr:hypothetical protein [Pseudalkalibacillus caeni]TLS38649.1 hypothetical protein FCL54_03875 [Pseudalkalibacillus caeni]
MKDVQNQGPVMSGIALSAIYLIARWVTGYVLLIGPEAMITVGLYAGVGVALFGTLSFILFSPIAKQVRTQYSDYGNLREFLSDNMSEHGSKVMRMIIFGIGFTGLVLQAIAGGTVLFAIFNIPVSLATLIYLLVSYLYSIIVGGERLRKYRPYNVGFLYFLLIILLIYFFILDGIETAFAGIRLYHPYLLILNWPEMLVFIGAGALVMLGQLIVDPVTWRQVFQTEKEKAGKTFLFTSAIWGTIPLAFSIMFVTVISTGGFTNMYGVLDQFFAHIKLPALFVLFSLLLLLILFSTFNSVLLEVSKTLKPKQTRGSVVKQYFWLVIPVAVVCIALLEFREEGLLELFYEFGIFYAAAISPISIMVYKKEKGDLKVPVCILSGAVIGYFSLLFLNVYGSIFISALFSLLISLALMNRDIRQQI